MSKQDQNAKRFQLVRKVDVTGVSGTGVVADGICWPDGTVTIRWRGDRPSTVNWEHLDHAKAVHGHGGHTSFMWLDVYPTADYGSVWTELRGYVQQSGRRRRADQPRRPARLPRRTQAPRPRTGRRLDQSARWATPPPRPHRRRPRERQGTRVDQSSAP